MNYTKHAIHFFLLMLLIPLAGCIKSEDFDFNKIQKMEWNPTIAVPLVSSNLTIMDMIRQMNDSSSFVIDDKGFVTLVYKDRLFSVSPASAFTIPTDSFALSHTFTQAEIATITDFGSLTIPYEQNIKLTPADSIRIDSLIYGTGDLTLTMSGTVTNNGSIAFSIPEAKKNGIPFSTTFTPLVNGSKTIDLSGYKFDLTKVPNKPSTFRLSATLTITNTAADPVVKDDWISFKIAQHTKSIQVLSGYLGQVLLKTDSKSTDINLFNNTMTVGDFILVNPYFIFTFHNSIGLPVNLRFTEIKGKSKDDLLPSVNLIGNPGIPDPIDILSPSYADADPVKVTTVRIDNVGTDGAISRLLNLLKPGNFIYSFKSTANPYGEQTENFLRDSGKLDLDVEFGLPFYGLVKDFVVQDTAAFKFDSIDEVESVIFRTIIDNEFPIEAGMQIYFTDENYTRLDSLVNSGDQVIIPPADVDLNTGELIKAEQKMNFFSYSRNRIENILSAKKILIKAKLNTSGLATQNIKIYNYYKLKVKLAAEIEIKKKI